MSKAILSAVVCFSLIISGQAVPVNGNLLRNTEFRGDNLGGLLNWNISGEAQVRRGAGPNGENILHFTAANGRSLAQMNLRLNAGEEYAFGGKVRTRGVRQVRLLVYNAGWKKSENLNLPSDTRGEWRDLRWSGKLMPSENGIYYFRLWGDEPLAADTEIDLCGLYLKPLTEKAAKGVELTPIENPRKVRILPIDPLLSQVNAADARMEFYYPGELSGPPSDYVFAARIDREPVVQGPPDARQRATLKFGAIASGAHRLAVKLVRRADREVIAANEYPIEAVGTDPAALRRSKKLNNFVTELQVTAEGNGFVFDNPREGWVYLGFADSSSVGELYLDGAATPVAKPRPGERCETLRRLTSGRHALTVKASGSVRPVPVVRAVKPILMFAGGDQRPRSDLDRFNYGLDFRQRYFFNRFAVFGDFNWTRKSFRQRRWSEIYDDRGAQYCGEIRLGENVATWGNVDRLVFSITNSAPFRDGLGVAMDESSPVAPRLNHANLAEAAWSLGDDPRPLGIWWNNCLRNVCADPRGQATELLAIANSGRGTGMLLPEVYVIAYPDRARVKAQEDHFVEFLKSIRAQAPAATHAFMLMPGGYTLPNGWCGWIAPEADLRVLYDDLLHRFATDPECADIGGVGYTAITHCDDDLLRWYCRLIRHYAIEGRTDKLADKYGLVYCPRHIVNNDFAEGFKGWKVEAAEANSAFVTNVYGFGTNFQGRKMVDSGYGDSLVEFVRSAKRPNRVSQMAKNLVPGRLYMLQVASCDADDYSHPITRGDEVVLKLDCGKGGEEIPELKYVNKAPLDRRENCFGPWTKKPVPIRAMSRIVFRAKASETEISISDWASDRSPEATVGARRWFNHVVLIPYYVEDEAELNELKSLFGTRDWSPIKPQYGYTPSQGARAAGPRVRPTATDETSVVPEAGVSVVPEDGVSVVPEARVSMDSGKPIITVNGEPMLPIWGSVRWNWHPQKRRRISDGNWQVVNVQVPSRYWWTGENKYDFAVIDRTLAEYAKENPTAYFVYDVALMPPVGWADAHPDDMCRDETGYEAPGSWERSGFSFASKQALADHLQALAAAIGHVKNTQWANRIIGYRVTGGHTTEWLDWTPRNGHVYDFSPVCKRGFAEWLQVHYPDITDASIPSLAERWAKDGGRNLWDPAQHRRTIAYREYRNELLVDFLVALCRRARECAGADKLIGTYYGYSVTLNADGWSQDRGHYALKRFLAAKCVDFIMSPPSYLVRAPGEASIEMKPFATMQAYGIVPILEDDTRTHNINVQPGREYAYYRTLNPQMTVNIMRRNAGMALCRLEPVNWYALQGATEFDFPEIVPDVNRLGEIGSELARSGVRRRAEVAVVVSEKSAVNSPVETAWGDSGEVLRYYLEDGSVTNRAQCGTMPTFETLEGNLGRYARMGTPVDYLLAEDLAANPGNYKLYIFANCYSVDGEFVRAVAKLRERKCTLLWCYAPGYTLDGVNSVDNLRTLTGLQFVEFKSGMRPVAKMLDDGRRMGPNDRYPTTLKPMFTVTSPGERWGEYLNGETAIAVAKTDKATTVFSGVYQFDTKFLRRLLKLAGVHEWADTDDPIEANDRLLVMHAHRSGLKKISLPFAARVEDAFTGEVMAEKSRGFNFFMNLHETRIFRLDPVK